MIPSFAHSVLVAALALASVCACKRDEGGSGGGGASSDAVAQVTPESGARIDVAGASVTLDPGAVPDATTVTVGGVRDWVDPEGVVVLGAPISIETADGALLLKPIQLTLVLPRAVEDPSRVAVLVIAKRGTADERRYIVANAELTVELGGGQTFVTLATRETRAAFAAFESNAKVVSGFLPGGAAPPDPRGIEASALDAKSLAVSLPDVPGAAAGYRLALAAGSTPPSSCDGGLEARRNAGRWSFTAGGLLPGTAYALRVCAYDDAEPRRVSGGATLAARTPREDFAILAPIGEADTDRPRIAWEPLFGAGSYSVALARRIDCSDTEQAYDTVTGTSQSLLSVNDGEYYVCVRARLASGQQVAASNNAVKVRVRRQGWTPLPLVGAPSARSGHSATWTGADVAVWGGETATGLSAGGALFDPSTRTWRAMSATAAPQARRGHTAVWTGQRLIVWGGTVVKNPAQQAATGGRYDPAGDAWVATTALNAPAPRTAHGAAWTGSLMLVWGGRGAGGNVRGDGAAYDPAADAWTPLTTTDAPTARAEPTVVWSGDKLLVWGGLDASGNALSSGALYDPDADEWTAMAAADAPIARHAHAAAWAGSRLVVWGGRRALGQSGESLDDGASFDPTGNAWQTLADDSNAPVARSHAATALVNGFLFVFGGRDESGGGAFVTGGLLNPATGAWRALATSGAPGARSDPTATAAGSSVVVFGGVTASGAPAAGGGVYLP